MSGRQMLVHALSLLALPHAALAFQRTAKGLLDLSGNASADQVPLPFLPRCLWGPESDGGHSARCQAVYDLAFEEYGEPAENISTYGCNVPKVPYHWVKAIQAMNHTKLHTFNFMGSHTWSLELQALGLHIPQFEARNWVIDFAAANFSDDDWFELSDTDSEYVPMGPWDHSDAEDSFDGRYAKGAQDEELDAYMKTFDRGYFQTMASSNFTLCPGGDMPWSMRFYEAIAAGSIPIIESPKFDWSAPHLWALLEIPYKYYIMDRGDEFVYRQDWVDYNFDLFVKYQTFHYGDLEPPKPTTTNA